jgi:asparagine synthase (glutamine-hydrolysing)
LREAFADLLPPAITAQPKTYGFGHAEQFQVQTLSLTELVDRAPSNAWNYLDRHTFIATWSRPNMHPMLWLPVSFLLWMIARHEQRF